MLYAVVCERFIQGVSCEYGESQSDVHVDFQLLGLFRSQLLAEQCVERFRQSSYYENVHIQEVESDL